MEPPITALSDAAIVYGAQRYFDGVHDDVAWPYRDQYRKEDDRALFLEFLHNLYLYDRIVLDDRPIDARERAGYGQLRKFLDAVNRDADEEVFAHQTLDAAYLYASEQAKAGRSSADGVPTSVQASVCGLVAEHLSRGRAAELRSVAVPWAYHQPRHQDHAAIGSALRELAVDTSWLPFTLFVWRAIWYGALARYQTRSRHQPFAYVAAPRRIQALRAVLDAKDLARYEFPRQAVRTLSLELPDVPEMGYDFGDLDFVSPFETTALSARLAALPPAQALRMTLAERRSTHARKVRGDWADLLSTNATTCVVGTTVIQMMRDMNVQGNVTQSVRLRGIPA